MSEEKIQLEEGHKCSCVKTGFLVFVALILSIASLATSIYTLSKTPIEKKVVISTQYDKGKSMDKALETKKPIIAFFYTDWCGFCQRFAPTFHKISKNKEIKKHFAIAYINCEDSKNSSLVAKYQVQGYPTVFVIDANGNSTQLQNNTFFNDDSVEVVSKKALEIIGKED